MSQIASKLREKRANVIFAVMKNVTKHYEQLRSFLDGAVVGELAEDSKNIVDLISRKYYVSAALLNVCIVSSAFDEFKLNYKINRGIPMKCRHSFSIKACV